MQDTMSCDRFNRCHVTVCRTLDSHTMQVQLYVPHQAHAASAPTVCPTPIACTSCQAMMSCVRDAKPVEASTPKPACMHVRITQVHAQVSKF